MGRRQLRGFHIFSAAVNEVTCPLSLALVRACMLVWGGQFTPNRRVQGRSADTFWPKVTERLQAAPGGAVATRLADAVRSGLEGEGQAEGPAQVVSSVLRRIFNRATTHPLTHLLSLVLTCRPCLMQ